MRLRYYSKQVRVYFFICLYKIKNGKGILILSLALSCGSSFSPIFSCWSLFFHSISHICYHFLPTSFMLVIISSPLLLCWLSFPPYFYHVGNHFVPLLSCWLSFCPHFSHVGYHFVPTYHVGYHFVPTSLMLVILFSRFLPCCLTCFSFLYSLLPHNLDRETPFLSY